MGNVVKAITYIHFKDNCLEAMNFYKECMGGELVVMKVGESPMADQMPGMGDMVMHSELSTGEWSVFASDWCAPSEYKPGNNFSVMLECASEAEQTELYAKLSDGGQATMPLSDTFWGSRFGMLKDKFGIDWMLNFTKAG